MSTVSITSPFFLLLFIAAFLIFSGVAVPLAFLGGSFFVAYMGLGSTGTFATNAFYILNSISMLAIPLFIVGGSLIERSGIANVLMLLTPSPIIIIYFG